MRDYVQDIIHAEILRHNAEQYDTEEKRDMARATLAVLNSILSRVKIFADHNCSYCKNGVLSCKQGGVNRCDNPIAKNH